jgi:glycosyltransferase involved in cell wall biosynthesis
VPNLLSWDGAFVFGLSEGLSKIQESKKPFVVTFGKPEMESECLAHGIKFHPKVIRERAMQLKAMERLPAIVFISQYVREIWRRFSETEGGPTERIATAPVIYHGIDCRSFCPSDKTEERLFTLGCSGSMRYDFRLRTLFEVSRALPFAHRLLIVGELDESSARHLKAALQDRELSERITYRPWVPHSELPNLYRQMDCLYHPVDFEGCCIVVIEALASGTAVVVPKHGAPQEYLGDGGIAVDTRQFEYDSEFVKKMAEAVVTVRENLSLFQRGARLAALERLTIERCADDYLEVLRQI